MSEQPLVIRVLDSDLGNRLPEMTKEDFVVRSKATIKDVVVAIFERCTARRIDRLTLICHGHGELVYGDQAMAKRDDVWTAKQTVTLPGPPRSMRSRAVCKIYGGYGLFFGEEELTLANVSLFRQLGGRFSADGLIEICGCAAADTGPAIFTPTETMTETLTGDGPALMRALAAATGASVRAAIYLQTAQQNWYLGTTDRTAFVGPTFLFKPNGQQIAETACF